MFLDIKIEPDLENPNNEMSDVKDIDLGK